MARKKNEVVVTPQPEFPAKAAARLEKQQNDASQRLAEVLTKFGDGLPYDTVRYEDKIRNHLSRSADEMLAAGRALVVVREHVPHGEWSEFLERLNLERRVAWRMCQAAIKFSNVALTRHLIEAAGNKTKLFELMVLDDEDIQELNNGGTVAGLNLDKVARASTAELRKQVRELQAEREATQKLLDTKNTALDKLRKQVEQVGKPRPAPPPDEAERQLRVDFGVAADAAEHAIRQGLHPAAAALFAHDAEHDTSSTSLVAGYVMQLQQALNDIRTEFQLPAFQDYVPRWLPDATDATDAPFVPTGGDVNLADLAVEVDPKTFNA